MDMETTNATLPPLSLAGGEGEERDDNTPSANISQAKKTYEVDLKNTPDPQSTAGPAPDVVTLIWRYGTEGSLKRKWVFPWDLCKTWTARTSHLVLCG
jgi:hypothetical protein